MEDLDRRCQSCNGTGRSKTGDETLDALERDVASLKWRIADLTEEFGLDLHHRATIPGEAEARSQVGELQVQLSRRLHELDAARRVAQGEEFLCSNCGGRGLVMTEAGEKVFNFIHRWIHPKR